MVALLKKIPLGLVEMSAIRERAEQLRDGNLCDYRPVLPLMLASFIFDVLCTPGKHQLLTRAPYIILSGTCKNVRYTVVNPLAAKFNIPFPLPRTVCAVVSPTGSRPPSRNRNVEMPGDEELGFEAAVAALGERFLLS